MSNAVFCSPIAASRLERAEAWLRARAASSRSARVTVIGASVEAANDITRRVIKVAGGASFGWYRCSLGKLAASLAVLGLAEQGRSPVGGPPIEALCARLVEELGRKSALGRYQHVEDRPGLPRALCATIQEIRLAGVAPTSIASHNDDLARAAIAFEEALDRMGLADRALILKAATRVVREGKGTHPLLGAPVLLLDARIGGALERELVAAISQRSPDVLATVPAGDERSLHHLREALRVEPEVEYGRPSAKRHTAGLASAVGAVSGASAAGAVSGASAVGAVSGASAVGAVSGASAAGAVSGARAEAKRQASAVASTKAPSAQAALSFAATGPVWGRVAPASTSSPARAVPAREMSGAPSAQALITAEEAASTSALRRLQIHLFSDSPAPKGELGADVVLLSAPGESRECVEIARRLRLEAERGVPFDRMAVLLRAPHLYRVHIQEALRRAGIPAHFEGGTRRPDPAGRAFLALLACAADNLSTRRFCEYLSLGEVPDDVDPRAPGDPSAPAGAPADEMHRRVPAEEDMLPAAFAPREEGETDAELDDEPEIAAMRAPRRWEQILIDAAVIRGRDRWERRLDRLEHELRLDLAAMTDLESPGASAVKMRLVHLEKLRAFAFPLLDALTALPAKAAWGAWIEALSALASRSLRTPERVLNVLAELLPMASVGPIDLREVRLVLSRRLTELVALPAERKFGRVFVAPIDAARGMAFDVVFIPGLAERIFPQKIVEDPILRDSERRRIGDLDTSDDRVGEERLALRLAVGAARERVILSYPRVDMDQSKPRVPSFYGLEVLRAAEGALPGFDELTRRAERVGEARIGWPAPKNPALAIDEAEHDLALLDPLFRAPEEETTGTARYLLSANPHLARALRFRARRWIAGWTSADGLLRPIPEAQKIMERHALAARSYSPTALQTFTACPYKFFLHAVHKLAPRLAPDAIEEMDPLQRGSLVHEAQFEALARLRELGLLPVTPDNLEQARGHIDAILSDVAARYRDDLAPAIDRVWEDIIASVRADLREWLRRSAELPEEREWVPVRFELSFGLLDRRARDPASQDDPAPLDCGIKLRGSIDLVERHISGALRATDYKTGKVRAQKTAVVGGGETLQPVFYALTLEKIFPDARVDSGRLYYCTTAGGFESVPIKLDERARQSAAEIATIVGEALEQGFLPAAPSKGACDLCDYQRVCGPYEELRTSRKRPEPLVKLMRLRSLP